MRQQGRPRERVAHRRACSAGPGVRLFGALGMALLCAWVCLAEGRHERFGRSIRPGVGHHVRGEVPDAGRQRVSSLPPDRGIRKDRMHPVKTRDEDYVHVELITECTSTAVGARPGECSFVKDLRVGFMGTHPGWTLGLEAVPLAAEGTRQTIAAAEVCWVPAEGDPRPLDRHHTVIDDGNAGSVIVDIRLALVTTRQHEAGHYVGELVISPGPVPPAGPPVVVPLEVDVQYRYAHSWEGSQIYFHFADLSESQTAVVNGSVSADTPVCLTLSATGGSVTSLPLLKRFGHSPVEGANIPVTWRLAEDSGGTRRPPDETAGGGETISWLLQGTPGEVVYYLDVAVSPEAHQAPGDYGMEVDVALHPIL